MVTVTDPQGGVTTTAYDSGGQPTVIELPNGTVTSQIYDNAGRITEIVHRDSSSSVFESFEYEYDNVGNRTQVTEDSGDIVTWTYDSTYQLTSERRSGTNSYATTWTYDATGNRLTEDADTAVSTYTYNAANQLLSVEDSLSDLTTYTYDNNGNQLTKEEPNGDLTTNTWDYENQTTQAKLPSGDVVTYVYNADFLRVSRDDDTDVTGYLWDKKNILHELDDTDTPQVDHHYQQQKYGNLVSRREGSESLYYHYDALGSTRHLTDSSETTTDSYTYTAWGKTNSSTGSTTNPYQWIGRQGYYLDEATGKHSLRRREYDKSQGRFTTDDPKRFESGDVNLHRYTRNRPTALSDPSGMQPPSLTKAEVPSGDLKSRMIHYNQVAQKYEMLTYEERRIEALRTLMPEDPWNISTIVGPKQDPEAIAEERAAQAIVSLNWEIYRAESKKPFAILRGEQGAEGGAAAAALRLPPLYGAILWDAEEVREFSQLMRDRLFLFEQESSLRLAFIHGNNSEELIHTLLTTQQVIEATTRELAKFLTRSMGSITNE